MKSRNALVRAVHIRQCEQAKRITQRRFCLENDFPRFRRQIGD